MVFVIGFSLVGLLLRVSTFCCGPLRKSVPLINLPSTREENSAQRGHSLCHPPQGVRRRAAERWLVRFMCVMFVVSWTGVIRYHGPRPMPAANRVWVANHTSMIDYIVLCAFSPFAAIMQLHPGWVSARHGGGGELVALEALAVRH